MLARFVDPRFVTPAFALFLELGPGKCSSNTEGVSFWLSIPTRVRNSYDVMPYVECSIYCYIVVALNVSSCAAYTPYAGIALTEAPVRSSWSREGCKLNNNLLRRISPHNFSLETSLQEDHTNIFVRVSAMAWAQPRASLQEAQEKV